MKGAGKTTVILQVLSTILLIVLIMLFSDISNRFRYLHDGIRENAVWSVYQLDREARALDYSLAELRRVHSEQDRRFDDLALRYDILYSRTKLVRESRFSAYFAADPTIKIHLAEIERQVYGMQSVFDGFVNGARPTEADLEAIDQELAVLSKKTEQLLILTNARVSDERTEVRGMVLDLERTSAIMLGLLMISVIFLVVTLRRQLKSVRQAGLRVEAMARELSDAYDAADAGNRAKSQFMATMGHEIRTPLNAILGMAELLEYAELPDDAVSSVKTIRSSGEALLEVINEILDFSKIEHGKLELEERAVDISSLAESTISIIRGRAEDHGNAIILDIPGSLHALYVRTDPTRLRQVMLNLLSNAVKFTQNGTVTLRLREFYRGSALMLRFEVEDTGIGIDEAGLERLFKPFSQVDASISRKYGGTGLGLTICKQIVEKLGGELGMSSTVGVGSIFWFELPVMAAGKEDVRHQAGLHEMSAHFPQLRILVVEDNQVNRQVATRFLDKLGQTVEIACNGAEAVALTETEAFDLILMDMQMPVMDGIEATRRIIEGGGPSALTPIIAMTANASDDDRRRCLAAGMVGFESKPVTMGRLRSVIVSFAPTGADPSWEPEQTMELNAFSNLDLSGDLALAGDHPFHPSANGIAGVDEARYLELVEALGEDVYRELIESFFDDATSLLADLHTALASERGSDIDRVLHTIKGAAINVGLSDIAVKADALRDQEPTTADVDMLSDEIETLKLKLVA
ncbi:response regulator [Rhizobium sp. CG5]|nr:response regulator [Rhizobium sp. CG5]